MIRVFVAVFSQGQIATLGFYLTSLSFSIQNHLKVSQSVSQPVSQSVSQSVNQSLSLSVSLCLSVSLHFNMVCINVRVLNIL